MIYWPTWRLAAALVLAAIVGGTFCHLLHLIQEELEMRREMRRVQEELKKLEENIPDSCEGCRWNLGDDCCSWNMADDCAVNGGMYNLWRVKVDE